MAYSNPTIINYSRAIGVSNLTWAVSPPKGATQCRVVGISVSPTTTYNAVTTAAKVEVGVASNVAVAGTFSIGTTAAGATASMTFTQGVNPLIPVIDLTGASNPSAIGKPYNLNVAN